MLDEKPWLIDAFKTLELGLTMYFFDDKSFRRLMVIVLDNAVEIAMWNYLQYEKGIKPPENDFHGLLEQVKNNSPTKQDKTVFFNKIRYYHDQRNPLYHLGTKITDIDQESLVKQGMLVLELFRFIFDRDFEDYLVTDRKINFLMEHTKLEDNIYSGEYNRNEIDNYDKVLDFINAQIPYDGISFNNMSDDEYVDITNTIREINNNL